MAFTLSTTWEINTSGSDSNAGGFDPGVAGFPTDGTVDTNTGNTAAPVFSSASYNFVAGDVGHWIYVKAGTSSIPGWYKIASVASNKATLNATIGAAVLAAGTPTTATGLATVGTPTSLTWGIDYSQSTIARIAFTDMVIGGTTTQFTSVANPVGKNFVGNIINVISGTGFSVQRVAVASTSGTTATCDKSLGTGASTGGTGNLGGALASPALPFSLAIAGMSYWIKTGSYTMTSGSSNVANGVISEAVGSLRIESYGTVRGDLGTPATITASGISSVTMISTAPDTAMRNFIIDGANLTAIRGVTFTGRGIGYLITAKNCKNTGIAAAVQGTLIKCIATGCSTAGAGINASFAFLCEAYSNTVSGFTVGQNAYVMQCLAYANSGASSDGFSSAANNSNMLDCTAYNNGRDGFRLGGGSSSVVNCIAESNSGVGFDLIGVGDVAILNCAAYLNGTNITATAAYILNLGFITLTASAFVAPGSGNFALNANAGGGASVRAAGIPGVTPDGLSTGYLDIGAIQSAPLYPPARLFTAAA